MKKIILLLLLLTSLNAQILSEQFNNFMADSTDSRLFMLYQFTDSTGALRDRSTNSHTLTPMAGVGDSVIAWNAWYNGGNSIYISEALSQFYKRANADNGIPGLNDVVAVLKGYLYTPIASTDVFFSIEQYNFKMYRSATTTYLLYRDAATGSSININNGSIPAGEAVVLVGRKGSTSPGLALYSAGSLIVSKDSLGLIYDGADYFTIGCETNNGTNAISPATIRISELAIYSYTTFTLADVNRFTYLANGWSSALGRSYRNSWAFTQGFFNGDTLSHTVVDTTNQSGYQWTATFDAWGGKSGDAVTMYLGSGTPVTQALTASSKSYTLNLGTVTTSGDSFYMIASAGDTVYVDNLVVTEDTTPTTTTRKRNFDGWGKYGGWLK